MGTNLDSSSLDPYLEDAVSLVTALDAWLVHRCADFRSNPWVASFFLAASRLGDGPLWYAVAVAGLGLGDGRIRWATAAAGVSVALSSLAFSLVKGRVARPRPYEVLADVPCLLVPPDRFSFPSGHTMNAFAVLGAFRVLVPGSEAVFLPLGMWIGASRVFLGVHYPSDVLVGAGLGTAVGTAVARIVTWLL